MNTKVWCLSYFEGVYHTRIIETFSNANARMVRMVHTVYEAIDSMAGLCFPWNFAPVIRYTS